MTEPSSKSKPEVPKNISLSLEYAYDQDYEQDKGGTDEEAQTVTTQLAMGF
ncbi:MAG: hypothetical protein K9K39_04015 [Desulfohalobiaceae bacterium]|nr:hypothetical protein [Desulfohalobiaceae bacterium]